MKNPGLTNLRKRDGLGGNSMPCHQASFTLIELMAASTVLSTVLLMMVGMQSQMSKAWSNANQRTDATREARAACRLIADDLCCLYFRPMAADNQAYFADGLVNQGVPFLYSSNGTGPITISNVASNSAYFFALVPKVASLSNSADLATVGYYVAFAPHTNVNGFVTSAYNLYRHYATPSNTFSNLNNWYNADTNRRTANLLFKPDPAKDDILARNTCNLRITAYNRPDGNTKGWGNKVTNGLNYQFVSSGSNYWYSGSKIQVEISVYPEESAQKIPYTNWNNSNNIRQYARSFEFRVDIPRD